LGTKALPITQTWVCNHADLGTLVRRVGYAYRPETHSERAVAPTAYNRQIITDNYLLIMSYIFIYKRKIIFDSDRITRPGGCLSGAQTGDEGVGHRSLTLADTKANAAVGCVTGKTRFAL